MEGIILNGKTATGKTANIACFKRFAQFSIS